MDNSHIKFISQIVMGVTHFKDQLDEFIADFAPEWPLDQVAYIDRNLLRIALWEIAVYKKTPVKVVINEAVELAKLYGAEGSPRFINGVLGGVIDHLEEIKIKYNTFSSFFVSDHTQRYYYSKGLLKTVQRGNSRDRWYFHISNLERDYEINLDRDMANHDTMTIFINHKVYDYDGNYIGATGVGLAIHAVKKLISTYQERYNRTIFFTDKTGNVTLHGQHFSKPVKNIFEIRGIAEHRQEINRGTPQSFKYKKDNKTFYMNTRYIPEFGWYLFVEQCGDKAIEMSVKPLSSIWSFPLPSSA